MVVDYIFDTDRPRACRWFLGRTRELEQLHSLLTDHSKVFVHGIPGIGKSELAKAYAKQHGKEYTNVLYVNYTGSLKQTVIDLDFADDLPSETEETRFKRHNRFLRSLKDDTLLIVDYFNVTATRDSFLDVMLISQFDKADDEGMKEANKWVASLESSLHQLEQSESRYQGELEAALDQFRELVQKTEPTDAAELYQMRQPLRKPMIQAARNMLQQTYKKKFSVLTMMDAERDVEVLLRDEEKQFTPKEKQPVKAPQKHSEKPQKRPKDWDTR